MIETLRQLAGRRCVRVSWGLSALAGLICAFAPLFGVHGVESAFALSVALPLWVAPTAALLQRDAITPTSGLRRVALTALLAVAIPVAILALNQLRLRQCEPWMGMLFMLLGPLPSALFAATGAAALATLRRWSARRLLLAVFAALFVFLFLGFYAFWSTSAIFVYSHAFGWFPGTLYDVGRTLPMALITFRGLTLLWALAFCSVVLRERFSARVLAAGFGALAIFGYVQGPELGHRSTADYIQDELGGMRRGDHCVVHYPRELRRADALRLLEDCDFRAARAARLLDVQLDAPVEAYFYRDAAEKQRLMGAGRTFIAKPWRNEVHLQLRGWPHPVLGHEVVHAVAAYAARGPFRVSGTLGGYWPNAMLIEGIAVALDWRLEDGLTPHDWSKAMRELDLLPSADSLQDLGFLGHDSRRSYGASGSLTRFFYERHGAEALQRAHRAGRFDVVEPLAELEAAWHAFLDGRALPTGALGLAETRFARSSIFERVCPHRVARLRAELGGELASGDRRSARQTCEEILAIEPAALDALVARVGIEARLGDRVAAEVALGALEGAPPQLKARAREALADAAFRRGRRGQALTIYRELLREPQTEGERRQREVKVLGLIASPEERARIAGIFIDDEPPASAARVVDLARDLDELRSDGLGAYLIGRQLSAAGDYERAARRFEQARLRGLPTEAVGREALRNLIVAHGASGRWNRVEALLRIAAGDPAMRHEVAEWRERLTFSRSL
ncbi:MAG: hypothetical protein AAF645_08995 [Myxococcota bacterium]